MNSTRFIIKGFYQSLLLYLFYQGVSFRRLQLWARPWGRPTSRANELWTTSRSPTASTCRRCRRRRSSSFRRRCFPETRKVGWDIRNVCCRRVRFRPFLGETLIGRSTSGRSCSGESAAALCFWPETNVDFVSQVLIFNFFISSLSDYSLGLHFR